MSKPFVLRPAKPPKPKKDAQPVFRLKPTYRNILVVLSKRTGLPLGNIIEQCIDYAIENMEGWDDE